MDNYIGDWYYFADRFVNERQLMDDLLVIEERPDEFDFSLGDAITQAGKILNLDPQIITALLASEHILYD